MGDIYKNQKYIWNKIFLIIHIENWKPTETSRTKYTHNFFLYQQNFSFFPVRVATHKMTSIIINICVLLQWCKVKDDIRIIFGQFSDTIILNNSHIKTLNTYYLGSPEPKKK